MIANLVNESWQILFMIMVIIDHGKFSLLIMANLVFKSWQFSLHDFFCHGKFQYESAMLIFLVHGKFSLREFRRGKF